MVTVDAGAPPTSPDSPSGDKPAEPEAASTPEPTPAEQPREESQQEMAAPEPPQPRPPQPDRPQPEPPRLEQPRPESPRPEMAAVPQPPQPAAQPSPNLEEALAPPQEPPPPAAHDLPTIRVPLPPWPTPRPPQAAPPPANAPASVQAPPSNSADWLIGKSRARNAYLDQVARLTARYRRYPGVALDNKQAGRVVTRVTIARDGRLIDVSIDTSSGWPAIDAAELETIRRSAPFPSVPNDMPGDPLILILPIHYDLPIAARNR